MCKDEDYKKNFKLYGPFLWTGFTSVKFMYHYWAVNYFYCYLNQIPKDLSTKS